MRKIALSLLAAVASMACPGCSIVGSLTAESSPGSTGPSPAILQKWIPGGGAVLTSAKLPDGRTLIGGGFQYFYDSTTISPGVAVFGGDGSFDPSFEVGMGFDNAVTQAVRQPDGRILVIGDFVEYGEVGVDPIVRLNLDGTLDPSFDLATPSGGQVTALLLLSNGQILVSGTFSDFGPDENLYRFNADGSRDTSFDAGSGLDQGGSALAVQSDGKILVGGCFTTVDGQTANRLARLNTDGSIDSSFDIAAGFDACVNLIHVRADGRFVVGGEFETFRGAAHGGLVGVTSTGALDPAFTPDAVIESGVHALLAQPGGKFVVGGAFPEGIARLNSDGTLDSSFDAGSGFQSPGDVRALTGLSDGRIAVGGDFEAFDGDPIRHLTVLNDDGSRDASFDVGIGLDSPVETLLTLPDDRIFAGGLFALTSLLPKAGIALLNADGSLDTAFSADGGPGGEFFGTVYALAVLPNGKFLAGGGFEIGGLDDLVRFNSDGTLDTTFSTGAGFDDDVTSIAVQSDGKILVGGAFGSYDGVAQGSITRLDADGARDPSFNPGAGLSGPAYVQVRRIFVQSDGKIIPYGNFYEYDGQDMYADLAMNTEGILRLNADGSLDPSYIVPSFNPAYVASIAFQSDGKLLVAGYGEPFVTRYTTSGAVDATFAFPLTELTDNVYYAESLNIRDDGRVDVVIVDFDGNQRIFRSEATGSIVNGWTPLELRPGSPQSLYALLCLQN